MNRGFLFLKRGLVSAIFFGVFFFGAIATFPQQAFALECLKTGTTKPESLPGSECASTCRSGFRAVAGFACLDPGGMGADTCCVPDVAGDIAAATCKGTGYYCSGNGKCNGIDAKDPARTCPTPENTVSLCCYHPSATSLPAYVPNPLGDADLITIIGRIVSTFLGLVGAGTLLVFVYAGVTYMTAAGEDKKVKKATDTMKFAVIGLVLIVFAYALSNFLLVSVLKGS